MAKHLILIDDSTAGFWENEPAWAQDHWPDYVLKTIDGNDVGSVDDIFRQLSAIEGAKEHNLYIVTDGHYTRFPETPTSLGGARTLDRALKMSWLARGVVFSDNPKLTEELQANRDVIVSTRLPLDQKIIVIREFFLTGNVPPKLHTDRLFSMLSPRIHDLENVIVSIRTDIMTLEEVREGKRDVTIGLIRDVWNDSFSEVQPGTLSQYHLFGGAKGLEYKIVELMQPLVNLTRSESKVFKSLLVNDKVDVAKVTEQLNIKIARERAKEFVKLLDGDDRPTGENLRQHARTLGSILSLVAQAIRELATELRMARDNEKESKGET